MAIKKFDPIEYGATSFDPIALGAVPATKESSGFVQGFAKDIISPFAKIGVGGYNALLGKEGQARNLPFLGETKPIPSVIKPGGLISPEGKLQQPINLSGLGEAVGAGFSIGTTIGAPGQGKPILAATEKLGQKITAPIVKKAEENIFKKIVEVVSPKLTAKETAEAVASRGTETKGIGKTIKTIVDPYIQKVADTVKKLVPDFKPNRTLSENINATRKVVTNLVTDLKSRVVKAGDGLVPFKELSSKLDEIGRGSDYIGLKGTQFEQQLPELKNY